MKPIVKREKHILVEVIRCMDCNRLNVALGNEYGSLRLGDHKCSGAWSAVYTFEMQTTSLKKDVVEACRLYGYPVKSED